MNAIVRISVLGSVLAVGALAQWLNYPTAGLPRTRDGKPDLAAPTPKTAGGNPDLAGIWLPADGTHFMDLAADLKPDDVPYQPWAKALATQRQDGVHKDDPLAQCMPPGVPRVETHGAHPFKILQMPRELVILYETSTNAVFREIFTDGRTLPTFGTSTGNTNRFPVNLNSLERPTNRISPGQAHLRLASVIATRLAAIAPTTH